jgi:hypothetical protein
MNTGTKCERHPGEDCNPADCTIMGEAQILEDRVTAIAFLVDAARDGVLQGCEAAPDCAGGMPLTAALEAAHVLARSIIEDRNLLVAGETRVRWGVLSPSRSRRAS